jgi:hypothetical protein
MIRTIAMVSQVMQRVSQLKVIPAHRTTSRTPISCINLYLLQGFAPLFRNYQKILKFPWCGGLLRLL